MEEYRKPFLRIQGLRRTNSGGRLEPCYIAVYGSDVQVRGWNHDNWWGGHTSSNTPGGHRAGIEEVGDMDRWV